MQKRISVEFMQRVEKLLVKESHFTNDNATMGKKNTFTFFADRHNDKKKKKKEKDKGLLPDEGGIFRPTPIPTLGGDDFTKKKKKKLVKTRSKVLLLFCSGRGLRQKREGKEQQG